jgi:very-short-patch-repair endonuclease
MHRMPIKNIIPGQRIDPSKLQRARELRREMTPAERTLWQALRGNKLGGFHFRRQQIMAGYIVDFYCHAANLVIELDGDVHLRQQEYDSERDGVLSEMGLSVLRFPNKDIEQNLPGLLSRILSACRSETGNAMETDK